MCLAVPMVLTSSNETMGMVELWGVKTEVDISLVQPINIGDYVLVHAGFAISKVDPIEAKKTIELFSKLT